MKAWVTSALPQGFEPTDVPDPEPKENEARIQLRAAALNHLDLHVIAGKRPVENGHVFGSDGAGIIEEIRGESSLAVGDEVMINPGIPCGRCVRCANNQECESVDILGYNTPGTYAEFVTVPIAQLAKKPSSLSFAEAAAASLDFLTAYRMLYTKAHLIADDTIAIWGASGGLGTSALALAKDTDARTIVFAGTDEKVQTLQKLGADVAVNYNTSDVVQKVREVTNGHGADVVFECVGAATWVRSIEMARLGGRIVISGTASGDEGTQDLSDIYYKQLTIQGSRMGSPEDFEAVMELLEQDRIRPHIDSGFGFNDLPDALERLRAGQFVGKLVVSA